MSTSEGICNAAVTYKKQAGTLTLHKRMLVWVPASGGAPLVNVENSRLTALFASKPGSEKAMLKVGLTPLPPTTATGSAPAAEAAAENHNFTFTASPPSAATGDRDLFKQELSAVIADNRQRAEAAKANPVAADKQANGATPAPDEDVKPLAGGFSAQDKGKGKEVTQGGIGTAGGAMSSTFALRRGLLESDPELNMLHRELVRSKVITEAEFWEGREQLVEAAAAEMAQKKGRSGEMVDPRPELGDGGEVTVKITPQLIKEIFEEYPAVLRAYNENVPEPLDVQQFWTRYFQSKLFNRNRTANRAAVGSVKDDPIFDRYLGEEDDGIEPKNMSSQHIYALLDLAATEGDQHERNTEDDVTMRAGRNKEAVPVLRRFNEHSERLLNNSLGIDRRPARSDINPGDAGARNSYLDDIVMQDLMAPRQPDRVLLNMQDRAKGPEEANKAQADDPFAQLDRVHVLADSREAFSQWQPSLAEYHPDKDALKAAMTDMAQNVKAKAQRSARDTGAAGGGLSPAVLNELQTLHASATELLRQFWAAVLPAKPHDLSAAALASPAMKAAKAERMKSHLEKTLVQIAKAVEGDRERAEGALQPVREAVEHAVKFFNSKAA